MYWPSKHKRSQSQFSYDNAGSFLFRLHEGSATGWYQAQRSE
jgi:hypothetical protein